MKTKVKVISLLAAIAILILSVSSVVQASSLNATRVSCPGPHGAACSACRPDPRYPNLYYCTADGKVRNYNSTCTWWSNLELTCANPAICDCVNYEYADHCASSCSYR